MRGLIDQMLSYGPLAIDAIKAMMVLIIGWFVAGLVARARLMITGS